MAERLDKYVLKNGMVILGEPMKAVESVAFDFLLPAGTAILPEGVCGAANVISDWIFRGAGDKNNRQLGEALDSLGLHRYSAVNSAHITIGATLEAENLAEALDLYGDVILRPRLEAQQFVPAKQLAIDNIKSLDDDPRQKVMLKLYEKFYPAPWGRSTMGEIDQIKALTVEKTTKIVKENFNLSETIFAMAGKYDFDAVCRQLEKMFEKGEKKPLNPIALGARGEKYTHIHNDGAQVHIGLMTQTVKPLDKAYYHMRIAVSILSGGMSSRLFTEVREKRGLCYAVSAKYHCLKDLAGISCYAGTTPDKAQETIDVIINEFNRLSDEISEEEIQRAKVGLKSALILQSESSSSRAGAIGSDYYMLGKVRSLDEIKQNIDAVTVDSVLQFLRTNKFRDFTIVTIGPKPVSVK